MTYPLAAGALISIMEQIPRVDDAVDVAEATGAGASSAAGVPRTAPSAGSCVVLFTSFPTT
jgi:hypothetical protein